MQSLRQFYLQKWWLEGAIGEDKNGEIRKFLEEGIFNDEQRLKKKSMWTGIVLRSGNGYLEVL